MRRNVFAAVLFSLMMLLATSENFGQKTTKPSKKVSSATKASVPPKTETSANKKSETSGNNEIKVPIIDQRTTERNKPEFGDYAARLASEKGYVVVLIYSSDQKIIDNVKESLTVLKGTEINDLKVGIMLSDCFGEKANTIDFIVDRQVAGTVSKIVDADEDSISSAIIKQTRRAWDFLVDLKKTQEAEKNKPKSP